MPHVTTEVTTRIAERQAVLEAAAARMKEEFVGIDGVIDTLITYVRPWFLFPQLQERPVVINLWGSPSKSAPSLELFGYGASVRT